MICKNIALVPAAIVAVFGKGKFRVIIGRMRKSTRASCYFWLNSFRPFFHTQKLLCVSSSMNWINFTNFSCHWVCASSFLFVLAEFAVFVPKIVLVIVIPSFVSPSCCGWAICFASSVMARKSRTKSLKIHEQQQRRLNEKLKIAFEHDNIAVKRVNESAAIWTLFLIIILYYCATVAEL